MAQEDKVKVEGSHGRVLPLVRRLFILCWRQDSAGLIEGGDKHFPYFYFLEEIV